MAAMLTQVWMNAPVHPGGGMLHGVGRHDESCKTMDAEPTHDDQGFHGLGSARLSQLDSSTS